MITAKVPEYRPCLRCHTWFQGARFGDHDRSRCISSKARFAGIAKTQGPRSGERQRLAVRPHVRLR